MYIYLNAVMRQFCGQASATGLFNSGVMTGRFHDPSTLVKQITGDDDDSRRAYSLEVKNAYEVRKVRRAYLVGEEVAVGDWMASIKFLYVAKREQVLWLYLTQGGVLEMRRELYEAGQLTAKWSVRPLTSERVNDFITRFHEASKLLSYAASTS
jgi:hypothetical protein